MKRIRIKEKNLPYVFLTGFAIILVIVSLLNSNVVTVQALPEKIVRIYVINQGSNTVSVINNVLHKVVATVPVGKNPIQMNGDNANIYVLNQGSNTVSVINQTTNRIVDTISIGSQPVTIFLIPLPHSVISIPVNPLFVRVAQGALTSTIPLAGFILRNTTRW